MTRYPMVRRAVSRAAVAAILVAAALPAAALPPIPPIGEHAFPGAIELAVDATDTDRRIMRVRETTIATGCGIRIWRASRARRTG